MKKYHDKDGKRIKEGDIIVDSRGNEAVVEAIEGKDLGIGADKLQFHLEFYPLSELLLGEWRIKQ